VLGSRHSFRDINVRHPQSTAFRAGEERWITQASAAVALEIVSAGAFTDALSLTIVGTGSVYMLQTAYDVGAGTDALSMAASLGNIGGYDIYNTVNNGNMALAVFGTHFEALLDLQSVGTSAQSMDLALFGSYREVVSAVDTGTEAWQMTLSVMGTYLQTVTSTDAGTDTSSLSLGVFGTHTSVTVHAGTYAESQNNFMVTVFGTYLAI
jgi:hypothetical protein